MNGAAWLQRDKPFFFSHNPKHQMSVIQVECIVTIRIQYVITDLMNAFRS